MFKLLRPGGAVLAVVHPYMGAIWNIYRALCKNEKWTSFIKVNSSQSTLMPFLAYL